MSSSTSNELVDKHSEQRGGTKRESGARGAVSGERERDRNQVSL